MNPLCIITNLHPDCSFNFKPVTLNNSPYRNLHSIHQYNFSSNFTTICTIGILSAVNHSQFILSIFLQSDFTQQIHSYLVYSQQLIYHLLSTHSLINSTEIRHTSTTHLIRQLAPHIYTNTHTLYNHKYTKHSLFIKNKHKITIVFTSNY